MDKIDAAVAKATAELADPVARAEADASVDLSARGRQRFLNGGADPDPRPVTADNP